MTRQEIRRNNMTPVVVRGSSGIGMDDCIAEICEIEGEIKGKIKAAIIIKRGRT